jgi:hypothetical protein
MSVFLGQLVLPEFKTIDYHDLVFNITKNKRNIIELIYCKSFGSSFSKNFDSLISCFNVE